MLMSPLPIFAVTTGGSVIIDIHRGAGMYHTFWRTQIRRPDSPFRWRQYSLKVRGKPVVLATDLHCGYGPSGLIWTRTARTVGRKYHQKSESGCWSELWICYDDFSSSHACCPSSHPHDFSIPFSLYQGLDMGRPFRIYTMKRKFAIQREVCCGRIDSEAQNFYKNF